MAKAHVHYQAILNERGAATLQTSLKVSSGANGFKVMDPFDWTKDKPIYQRWQEKSKISYFHHWVNGMGIGHIELWKNNKILISQSEYDRLEEHQTECKSSS